MTNGGITERGGRVKEIIGTITFNVKKYYKVADETGTCDGCCWNDEREGECAAPSCETFWGCTKGDFIWKKVKEQSK